MNKTQVSSIACSWDNSCLQSAIKKIGLYQKFTNNEHNEA